MKRWLLVVFASLITYIAFAQETYTYTHTKDVRNGVEYESQFYNQYKVVFKEDRIEVALIGSNTSTYSETYFYDHQENGWSIYYRAVYNPGNMYMKGGWVINKHMWYSVSPDKKTINHPYHNSLTIGVLKQGVQNKSVGTMYE